MTEFIETEDFERLIANLNSKLRTRGRVLGRVQFEKPEKTGKWHQIQYSREIVKPLPRKKPKF